MGVVPVLTHVWIGTKHVLLCRIKHCFQGQVTRSINGKTNVAIVNVCTPRDSEHYRYSIKDKIDVAE